MNNYSGSFEISTYFFNYQAKYEGTAEKTPGGFRTDALFLTNYAGTPYYTRCLLLQGETVGQVKCESTNQSGSSDSYSETVNKYYRDNLREILKKKD